MAAPPNLGEFEHLVLLAVLRLGEDAYGVSIRAEMEKHTGRRTAPGALYTTLDRLENKGLLQSRVGDPSSERGGRARRFYTVTIAGRHAVVEAQRVIAALSAGLNLKGAIPCLIA